MQCNINVTTFPTPLLSQTFSINVALDNANLLNSFTMFLNTLNVDVLHASVVADNLSYYAFSDRAAFLYKRKGVVKQHLDGSITLDKKNYRLRTEKTLRIYEVDKYLNIDCKWIRKHVSLSRTKLN